MENHSNFKAGALPRKGIANQVIVSVTGAVLASTLCIWGIGNHIDNIPKTLMGAGDTVITQVSTPLALSAAAPYDGHIAVSTWTSTHANAMGNVTAMSSKLDHAISDNDGYVSDEALAEANAAKKVAEAAMPSPSSDARQYSVGDLEIAYGKLDKALAAVQDSATSAKAAEEQARIRAEKLSVITSGIDAGDWSDEKIDFVAEWGPRIDSYLSGRPLCGYGEYFAAAAYDNDVDPRIGAAISVIESGGGQICFRSCNAWGWGNSSWSSWEESIPGWTAAFHRGYGYDMDYSECRAYCPPNAGYYDKLRGQMESI